MVRVTVIVREVGDTKPEYFLDFELPSVPAVGDYISINRLDTRKPRQPKAA